MSKSVYEIVTERIIEQLETKPSTMGKTLDGC